MERKTLATIITNACNRYCHRNNVRQNDNNKLKQQATSNNNNKKTISIRFCIERQNKNVGERLPMEVREFVVVKNHVNLLIHFPPPPPKKNRPADSIWSTKIWRWLEALFVAWSTLIERDRSFLFFLLFLLFFLSFFFRIVATTQKFRWVGAWVFKVSYHLENNNNNNFLVVVVSQACFLLCV